MILLVYCVSVYNYKLVDTLRCSYMHTRRAVLLTLFALVATLLDLLSIYSSLIILHNIVIIIT